jgi:hypothetical protein
MSRRRRYNRAPYVPANTPDWHFVEKHCPGALTAWKRDVGLPDADFMIGVTGGSANYPLRAIASPRDWSSVSAARRKCYEYLLTDKTWRQVDL